jgi:hypothetical protein
VTMLQGDSIGANRERNLRFLLFQSGREYKAVFVVADEEVGQFSDEITVNCAPMV